MEQLDLFSFNDKNFKTKIPVQKENKFFSVSVGLLEEKIFYKEKIPPFCLQKSEKEIFNFLRDKLKMSEKEIFFFIDEVKEKGFKVYEKYDPLFIF